MPDVAATTQVAEGVHRLGSKLVNYYLVEDGDALTVIDAGLPGLRPSLDATLAALGRAPGDIQALVLTHAHNDHVGIAERLRAERPDYFFESAKELEGILNAIAG